MYRFLLLALIASLASSCSMQQSPRTISHTDLAFLDDASVVILASHEGELLPSCGGVWISFDTILTAYHCVDDAGLTPELQDLYDLIGVDYSPVGQSIAFAAWRDSHDKKAFDNAYSAVVIAIDAKQDLALAKTSSVSMHNYADVSTVDPSVGDLVHIVGATAGLAWSYTPGVVSAVRDMENMRDTKSHLLQIASAAWRGNSGGGVFDSDGRLLGICSFLAAGTQMSFFVSGKQINEFLRGPN